MKEGKKIAVFYYHCTIAVLNNVSKILLPPPHKISSL